MKSLASSVIITVYIILAVFSILCYGHGLAGDRQRRVEVYLPRLLITCWDLGG
jgi:hypothetical protein